MNRPRLLQAVLMVCYPALIFFGLQWMQPRAVAGLLALLLVLRKHREMLTLFRGMSRPQSLVVLGLLGWTGLCVLTNDELLLRLYPVAVSLGMLLLFGASLVWPPTMIQRFAMLSEPDPDALAVAYMYKVTQVWCLFFVFNAAVAGYTAFFTSRETWALYNGLLSYMLMGCLFVGEWLVRRHVQPASKENKA